MKNALSVVSRLKSTTSQSVRESYYRENDFQLCTMCNYGEVLRVRTSSMFEDSFKNSEQPVGPSPLTSRHRWVGRRSRRSG